MHNERLCNPLHPITKELKKLTKLKTKTEKTMIDIRWLEWRGGLYEHQGRPVLPSDNVLAALVEGARKSKKGKDVSAGVVAAEPHFLLKYKGPKTIDELDGNEDFCDYRSVVVSRRRTMRARPLFAEWSADIELFYDAEIIQLSDIIRAFEVAGERIGIGDRRPRNGRFEIVHEYHGKRAKKKVA
jgi:hypothetical protein